ncbi:hypothetical protein SALBM135S_09154 [Streptomyces alboniger]
MDDEGGVGAVVERGGAVEGPRLGLQGITGSDVRDIAAEGVEGVLAEDRLQPLRDLGGPLDAGARGARVVAEVLAVGVEDRQTALGPVGRDVEPADRERGEIARLRLVGAPVVAGPAQLRTLRLQHAVGDRLRAVGHGDRHVVRGLVQRVVVGGEPPRGGLRLLRGDTAVRRPVPGRVAVDLQLGRLARVPDDDRDRRALGQPRGRRDLQLLVAGLRERRLPAVDPHLGDLEPEVEVEARKVLRGAGVDRRRALQEVGGGLVVQPQVVVRDVVTAVAARRIVGIADARGPGGEVGGRCRDRQQQGGRDRSRDDESAVHVQLQVVVASQQGLKTCRSWSPTLFSPCGPRHVHGPRCHTIAIRPTCVSMPQAPDAARLPPVARELTGVPSAPCRYVRDVPASSGDRC